MEDRTALVNNHYGSGGILEKIKAGLKSAGKDLESLSVDDLASVDALHTRGRVATLELAEKVSLKGSDLVLDVGCGLGGTARYLADRYGCKVVGIDLTEEFIEAGQKLTALLNLSEQVELRRANALTLPFEEARFDVVWTEHAQMNIADKEGFYGQIARVLKPGGRLLFHDIFRGLGAEPTYPTPWAEDDRISFLATEARAREVMEQAGMKIVQWHSKVRESIDSLGFMLEKIESEGPPPIGIHLFMGVNARDKLQNYVRNLIEDRVTVAMGIAIREHAD